MDFKTFLTEAKEKTAVMAFGRYNPPTIGHEKLIHKVHEVAKEHGGEAHIIASHSEGTGKDPLPQHKKVGYLKKVAPAGVHVSGSSKEHPSIFHAASKLHAAGHKHLVVVAGSDRVDEYKKALHKYNNVAGKHGHYNFKSIKVVSAGQRDPDAEGAEGMSGTKLRSHARSGNMEKFKSGLPKALHPHAEEIAKHIQSVKEDYDNPYRFDDGTPEGTEYMKMLTPGESSKSKREKYVDGEIFKVGTRVTTNEGVDALVTFRGSNYVTIQYNDGVLDKKWLDDIEEATEVRQDKDIKSRAGTQPAKYHTGLSKATKTARDVQFKKQAKMDSKDPAAYKPAPGDASAETKPSKYTRAYKKAFEQKIPMLLQNYKLLEEAEYSLEFHGIRTKNLDQCPIAYEKFKPMIETMKKGELIDTTIGKTNDVAQAERSTKLQKFAYYTGL